MKKNKIIKWKMKKSILKTGDYKLNNHLAKKIAEKGFRKIVDFYTDVKPNDIERILKKEKIFWEGLKGVGVDLGGGIGCVSSIVARKKENKKIYCLDAVENAVKKCHPIVKNKILKKNAHKVISVIGDFDKICLKDSSVDFCLAWASLHHSRNVVKTLKEAKRITKNNGKILIVDRAHNNSTPNSEIQRMLNIVYSKEFLKKYWLPENKVFTRRDNGEHEYRYKDWENFFKKAKLKIAHSFILKENVKKNINFKNDNGIKEFVVNFRCGGFEKKIIMYLLKVEKN